MKHIIRSVFLSAIATFSITSFVSADEADGIAAPGTSEYVVKTFKSDAGNLVNALKCSNGTLKCRYKWDALCSEGKAFDADPEGNISGLSYFPDSDGVRMRIFVCRKY